ncbi:MAG: hypothetical protein WCE79_05840 [Xanthobacteraceae bacterium]
MASTNFFLSRNLIIVLLGFGFAPAPALAVPVCKPIIGFKEVRFSPTHRETMERTWSATLSVDASRCASTSGRFEILFTRLKENAPEVDFSEQFKWKLGSIDVSVPFWADEAVEGYWLHSITACPCRD